MQSSTIPKTSSNMRILLAIPSKDQVQYLDNMISALEAQSVLPDAVLYLMDRPSGRDRITASRRLSGHPFIKLMCNTTYPAYIGRPQCVLGEDQFLTGYIRELAIGYMLENGFDAIVFLDGDCIPEKDFVSAHKSVLSSECPVTTVGKRKEDKHGGLDQREKPNSAIKLFFDDPTEVSQEVFFVDSGVVWTCNFGFNLGAIKSLMATNELLYNRKEVFPSDFLGTWGGEDGFIGLLCFYTGIPVIALPNGDNGIRHIEHERPGKKYNHVQFIEYLEDHRYNLIKLLDLYGKNVRKLPYVDRGKMVTDAGIVHDI